MIYLSVSSAETAYRKLQTHWFVPRICMRTGMGGPSWFQFPPNPIEQWFSNRTNGTTWISSRKGTTPNSAQKCCSFIYVCHVYSNKARKPCLRNQNDRTGPLSTNGLTSFVSSLNWMYFPLLFLHWGVSEKIKALQSLSKHPAHLCTCHHFL